MIRLPVSPGSMVMGHGLEIKDANGNTVCYVHALYDENIVRKAQDIVDALNASEVAVILCDPACPHMAPHETDQTRKKESHFCWKFKHRLLHEGHHPGLVRLIECAKEEEDAKTSGDPLVG